MCESAAESGVKTQANDSRCGTLLVRFGDNERPDGCTEKCGERCAGETGNNTEIKTSFLWF